MPDGVGLGPSKAIVLPRNKCNVCVGGRGLVTGLCTPRYLRALAIFPSPTNNVGPLVRRGCL